MQDKPFYFYFKDESSDGSIVYFFMTGLVRYIVSFDPNQYNSETNNYPHLLTNGVGLAFFRYFNEQDAHDVCSIDLKIRNTLLRIIDEFMKGQVLSTVLLYHCDYHDARQAFRSNIFQRWFNVSSHIRDSYIHDTLKIEYVQTGTDYYLGYICQKDNPHCLKISEEFTLFGENLIAGDK